MKKSDKRIEMWPLEKLQPNSRNARTHSPAQVTQIAASIVEFGFTNPILATSQGDVIAGHGRLLAAQSLNLTEVPVVVLDHLSETQRRAYIIADNKLALNAAWDEKLLAVELLELGTSVSLVGFDDSELASLASLLDEDVTSSASLANASQLGVLEYRLIVDCASEEHQAALLERFEAEGLICRPLIS